MVTIKSAILWIVTPYSSERVQCYGGTYNFLLHGCRASQESRGELSFLPSARGLPIDLEDVSGVSMTHQVRSELHDILIQKATLIFFLFLSENILKIFWGVNGSLFHMSVLMWRQWKSEDSLSVWH